MNREILIQALQSEGVVNSVIEAALVKAELYNIEHLVRVRVGKAMERCEEYNVFEARSAVGQLRKRAV